VDERRKSALSNAIKSVIEKNGPVRDGCAACKWPFRANPRSELSERHAEKRKWEMKVRARARASMMAIV
jgi:hypothetical protein